MSPDGDRSQIRASGGSACRRGWALGSTVVGARLLADLEGQVQAINKSQAVVEFDMDGTIRAANATAPLIARSGRNRAVESSTPE